MEGNLVYSRQVEGAAGAVADPERFQRDRDRILYSNAFRRLAGVTQVVSPMDGDVVHNRLTHTLKVAQIARRIVEHLLKGTTPTATGGPRLPNADIVEAAALAHDLGHPPFGHVGEETLNERAADHGGFEGNAQSLRIVATLSVRSPRYDGLNLTRGVLNGLLKYPYFRDGPTPRSKWGAYNSEKSTFDWAREGWTEIVPEKRTLEAQIMDYADDVAYAVHDVHDFFRAGLIPLDVLANKESARREFLSATRKRWEREGKSARVEDDSQLTQYGAALEQFVGLAPVFQSYSGDRSQQALLGAHASVLIRRFVTTTKLVENGHAYELFIPPEIQAEVSILKALNWHYVIQSSSLRSQQHGYRRIVGELFEIFAQEENRNLVPPWIGGEIHQGAIGKRYACDVVASLSDQQAVRLYRRLTGTEPGTFKDWN